MSCFQILFAPVKIMDLLKRNVYIPKVVLYNRLLQPQETKLRITQKQLDDQLSD